MLEQGHLPWGGEQITECNGIKPQVPEGQRKQ